ncbi:MAG: hypothetical protein AAGC72_15005 [Planctomycetota bacterium]
MYRINPYAACVVKFGHNSKMHLYLNAALPDGFHYSDGICPKCGHAYSHLLGRDGHCDECEGDRIAMLAMDLEKQGVQLGWGWHAKDAINIDYLREQYGRPTASLQSDAKEV